MKRLLKNTHWLLLIIVTLSSCTAYKKLPYLTEAELLSSQELAKSAGNYEAKVMPKDILSIIVSTPTSAASADFNLTYSTASDAIGAGASTTNASAGVQDYIVDNDGYINFPIIGKLKVGGLTKGQLEQKLHDELYPKYMTEEPIINIRFQNYKVTVLGEVNKPGVYASENEQMTIFDALALAGDLTIYGKRDNVMLIREKANGEREVRRIDLQDKNLLLDNSTYYLQQNDKLYIQPNKSKGNNSQFGTMEGMAISGLSLIISIVAILTR